MKTQLEKPLFIIDHCQLFYMVSGTMTLQIDEQTVSLYSRQGILLPPGSKFQVLKRSEDALLNIYGFMCRGEFLLPLCQKTLSFSEDEQNLLGELADFAESVLNDAPVPTSAYDSERSVVVCLAAAQSAKEGRSIQIEYPAE